MKAVLQKGNKEMYKRYSEDDKQKVLDLYSAGEKTVKDISKETMVPIGTINSWITKYAAIKRRPSKQRKKPAKSNGGRPKKIGSIRDCELKVKMTRQEIEELNKKALEKNIYVSDYVRGMLFGQVDNSVLFIKLTPNESRLLKRLANYAGEESIVSYVRKRAYLLGEE